MDFFFLSSLIESIPHSSFLASSIKSKYYLGCLNIPAKRKDETHYPIEQKLQQTDQHQAVENSCSSSELPNATTTTPTTVMISRMDSYAPLTRTRACWKEQPSKGYFNYRSLQRQRTTTEG
jgi:hypothetical protein